MSFGEGDLHAQVDRLKELNGELCAEINEKDMRIRELEAESDELRALVRDMRKWPLRAYGLPWPSRIERRIRDLGIEAK